MTDNTCCYSFLAHLSRRLTRWAYSIPMVRRPSVVVVVVVVRRRPHFQTWIFLKPENSGFHGNRKPPLTYNGENDVSTFSRLFLFCSFLYLMKILHFRTWISLRPVGQSWSNFMRSITRGGERLHNVLRQIGSKLWCPWQQEAPIIMGKMMSPPFLGCFWSDPFYTCR